MDFFVSFAALATVIGIFLCMYIFLKGHMRKAQDAILLALMHGPATGADLQTALDEPELRRLRIHLQNMEGAGLVARSQTPGGTVYLLTEAGEVRAWRAKDIKTGLRKPNQS